MSELIDLSHSFDAGTPVLPGDLAVNLLQAKSLDKDGFNYFTLQSGLHASTHLDAPFHYLPKGKMVKELPLANFLGGGCLIDVRGEQVIGPKPHYTQLISKGDILLLYTGYSALYGTHRYYFEHPTVSLEMADFLVEREIKILGVDLPSPDCSPFAVHERLLGAEILILENLTNLEALVDLDEFEIMAFPVKISAEACPVRVVARKPG